MMSVKSGRLQFLAPHILRSHLLRPGVVKMCLRMGLAQQMPAWAKLQFLNAGVRPADLEDVLSRITSLETWVDEWEALGLRHERAGTAGLAAGDRREAAEHFKSAAVAYNFAQYVLFFDIQRKRTLHRACVSAYGQAAPLLDPPARRVEIPFRRRSMVGYLRVPPGAPAPVIVVFNGTNAVKEELHAWSEAMLDRGLAVLAFDGPGLGETWHRLSMVAEPRPVGRAIMDHLEKLPEVDARSVAMLGMSLGGYLAIRMASFDRRIKAVAAVCPPFSADIYWNVTLASMRRELAALYDTDERTMAACVNRITLGDVLPALRCPLLVVGGGRDMITPGREAWRIFEAASCDRELIYYPTGLHDCFNVMGDLRPRMLNWIQRALGLATHAVEPVVTERRPAAEAVDPGFAEALTGEPVAGPRWHATPPPARPAAPRWTWPALVAAPAPRTQVVLRRAAAAAAVPSAAGAAGGA
jgi:2,6-dihydroxypseudooxynicotine hydrolase